MSHCSTRWATYLMSLKQLVETGTRRPLPARGPRQQLDLTARHDIHEGPFVAAGGGSLGAWRGTIVLVTGTTPAAQANSVKP